MSSFPIAHDSIDPMTVFVAAATTIAAALVFWRVGFRTGRRTVITPRAHIIIHIPEDKAAALRAAYTVKEGIISNHRKDIKAWSRLLWANLEEMYPETKDGNWRIQEMSSGGFRLIKEPEDSL